MKDRAYELFGNTTTTSRRCCHSPICLAPLQSAIVDYDYRFIFMISNAPPVWVQCIFIFQRGDATSIFKADVQRRLAAYTHSGHATMDADPVCDVRAWCNFVSYHVVFLSQNCLHITQPASYLGFGRVGKEYESVDQRYALQWVVWFGTLTWTINTREILKNASLLNSSCACIEIFSIPELKV